MIRSPESAAESGAQFDPTIMGFRGQFGERLSHCRNLPKALGRAAGGATTCGINWETDERFVANRCRNARRRYSWYPFPMRGIQSNI